MSEDEQEPEGGGASWILSLLMSLGMMAVAIGATVYIFNTEPTAQREGASKKTAMLVDVATVDVGTHRPQIVAQGTVTPMRDVTLRPQVSGLVVSLGEGFVPGGFVEEGDVLVELQAADYKNTLAQRQSELRQALSSLKVEEGRTDAAQAEVDYLDKELTDQGRELVLRKPQLTAAKERVRSARAAVNQARLNLSRTTIVAPFDAHVLRRDVNVGSQVGPGDALGRLVGVDAYWVSVELPLRKLRHVEIASEDGEGSKVEVRNRTVWAEGTFRRGRLTRLVGALDPATRMATVLATVLDPMARTPERAGMPKLMIGEYVEVLIAGEPMEGVVRLPREYLRGDDTVWVMKDGKLSIRTVAVAAMDADYAYLTRGVEGGDEVVTSELSTVVDGAKLRLEGEGPQGEPAAAKADGGSGE